MLIKLSYLIIFYSLITLLSFNNTNVTPPKKTLQILTCCGEIEFFLHLGQNFLTKMSRSLGRSDSLT